MFLMVSIECINLWTRYRVFSKSFLDGSSNDELILSMMFFRLSSPSFVLFGSETERSGTSIKGAGVYIAPFLS